MITSRKTALIAGASGLVGSFCLQLLLQSNRYSKVITIGRSKLPVQHPKLEQLMVDFNKLEDYRPNLMADDIYCCLGTTIKKAGSKENFYQVDYTYVVNLAAITSSNPGSQFLVVSSLGANANSGIFYSRVKGEMEHAIKALPFRSIHIFQPSLLLGPRSEKRLGEKLAQAILPKLNFLLSGPLRQYRAVPAEEVARAMLGAAQPDITGVHVHSSAQISKDARFH